MTDDSKPAVIEVDGPDAAEIELSPFWVIPEPGTPGPSIRLIRAWVFQKVQSGETPLTAGTVQYIEMVAQLIANGITPPKVVK